SFASGGRRDSCKTGFIRPSVLARPPAAPAFRPLVPHGERTNTRFFNRVFCRRLWRDLFHLPLTPWKPPHPPSLTVRHTPSPPNPHFPRPPTHPPKPGGPRIEYDYGRPVVRRGRARPLPQPRPGLRRAARPGPRPPRPGHGRRLHARRHGRRIRRSGRRLGGG